MAQIHMVRALGSPEIVAGSAYGITDG